MRLKSLTSLLMALALLVATSSALGRGGAGGGRAGGGGGRSSGGMQRSAGGQRGGPSGGFGGGMSASRGGAGGASMGPHGRAGASGAGGQMASARGSRPGAGAGGGGAGRPGAAPGARPGAGARPGGGGAGEAGREGRPGAAGAGVGKAGGTAGTRPGAGAAGPRNGAVAGGAGARPTTDADKRETPRELRASGATSRPGIAGTGAATNGTYHRSAAAEAAQGDALRANAGDYRNYGHVDAYAGYANAWRPNAVVAGSFYTHPGYGALATGLGLAAVATPYNYGTNVVTQPTTVYVNGDPAGAPQDYANQATQIAATGQAAQPADDTKWLPLGVFAMVQGDATNSDDIFQLAVDKEGIIRGNYHNVKSDDVETITGSVDKQSQRAAWTIGSDQYPVYEAGISNLTKAQTPVLVHTGDGGTNQVSLIRLEEPPQQ